MPIIKKFEAAINRSMLLESEKKDMYFAVDTTELLKGDMKSRYEAYRIGLDANFLQPDEVRYKEDLPPLGLDFIKLGLNDVLYDPKTKQIYTPNTNQTAQMSGNMLTDSGDDGIIEGRSNEDVDYIQDPDTGLMNGSRPKSDGIDLLIGKTLSASAKNYQVKLPESNQHAKLVEGQTIHGKVFAGKGTNVEIRERYKLESEYNIPAAEWRKMSGTGKVVVNGKPRLSELHWYEAEGEIVKMKVKRYIDES